MNQPVKSGFAFHVHHNILMDWCYDYDERVRAIKETKPESEQELRLRLFRLIPSDRLPQPLVQAREAFYKAGEACYKAGEAYNKAWVACDKAREACNKAWEAYQPEIIKLHQELCPNCPWDGTTIFA